MAEQVLVTGASGFVGSHLVRELLERGYHVRATVRSLAADEPRVAPLRALAGAERLTWVQAELEDHAALTRAVAGVGHVLHAASPYRLTVADPERELLRPAVEGTRAIVRAALAEPSVRTLVLTSSVAALSDAPPNDRALTEHDWNASSTLARNPYYLSKTRAERAAYEAVASEPGSALRLVSVLPGLVLGPCLSPHVSDSHHVLLDLLRGKIPGYVSLAWGLVDVRDVARAHVDALERPEARGRYLCVAATRTLRQVVTTLRRAPVSHRGLPRVPWDNPIGDVFVRLSSYLWPRGTASFLRSHLGRVPRYDTARLTAELGITFRDVEATLLETVESLRRFGHVE